MEKESRKTLILFTVTRLQPRNSSPKCYKIHNLYPKQNLIALNWQEQFQNCPMSNVRPCRFTIPWRTHHVLNSKHQHTLLGGCIWCTGTQDFHVWVYSPWSVKSLIHCLTVSYNSVSLDQQSVAMEADRIFPHLQKVCLIGDQHALFSFSSDAGHPIANELAYCILWTPPWYWLPKIDVPFGSNKTRLFWMQFSTLHIYLCIIVDIILLTVIIWSSLSLAPTR